MTISVPRIRLGVLRWPALFGLGLFASLAANDASSQTPDTLAVQQATDLPVEPQATDLVASRPTDTRPSPFAGFETHYLSNGLKVWFKHMPEAPNVSISVGVPYGWDADPRGKEELAHLTEHILFSDHEGRSEEEIKNAIDAIGGRRNGFTTPDHSWYYVTVAKEHGAFALEWLARVVSPHAVDADLVERNRLPVALEIGAQPREIFQSVWAMLNPSWLQPPDFWRREFGMETRSSRRYDRWASLQRITHEDVIDFYDRHYVPEAMTLTVIGDLDRAEVLAISERTLGSLIKRPVPPPATVLEDPARRLASTYWGFGPNVRYTARYKLFDSSAQDDLMLLFVRDLLGRRLNQRLRYGQQKAVYGVQVNTTQRGPAGFLQIDGLIAESEYDFARGIIQEEIAALVGGTLSPEEFEADRTALTERLRVENSTAQALNFWVLRNFYDPSRHTDFPDVLSFFQDVTQGQVAAFATRTFVPEREVSTLVAVQPTSQVMLAAAVLLLVFVTIRAIAWALTRPVTMPGILYMARFRVPPPLKVGIVLAFGLVGLILARLIVFGAQSLSLAYVVTADEYSIQMVYYSAMLVTAVALFILYLSRFPHKILVFPDHVRIKFLAYRSRIIKPDELLELSTRRIQQVWFKKDLFRCIPMAMGLLSPGIYLRPTKGKAYFFRTRDTQELIDVLGGWRGVSVTPAVLKKKPSAEARDPFQEAMETSDWIASNAPEGLPEEDDSTASSSADPLPGLDEQANSMASDELPGLDGPIASMASDPLPGPEDASASFASDALPGLEDSSASIASDPIPGLDGPSTSIDPDPIPQEDAPVSIASLAPDDSGDVADSSNGGMGENEIKELLGNSYKTELEEKF